MKNIFKLALVFMFLLTPLQAKESAVNIFASSRDVPTTKLTAETGTKLSLADFGGQFVVAVFWSRNCGPCLKELKDLNTFSQKALYENIRVILISPSNEWHSSLEQRLFLKKYGGGNLEFYTDKKGKLAADFGIFSSPHAVLINQEGQEIGRIRGTAKWADKRMMDYIKSLMKN